MHRIFRGPSRAAGPFRLSRSQVLCVTAVAGLGLVAALWLRYGVLENSVLVAVCQPGSSGNWCRPFRAIVWLFNNGLLGAGAIILAGLLVWRPSPLLLAAATVLTALGLVLYNTAPAALAGGMISLAFARPAMRVPEDATPSARV